MNFSALLAISSCRSHDMSHDTGIRIYICRGILAIILFLLRMYLAIHFLLSNDNYVLEARSLELGHNETPSGIYND